MTKKKQRYNYILLYIYIILLYVLNSFLGTFSDFFSQSIFRKKYQTDLKKKK